MRSKCHKVGMLFKIMRWAIIIRCSPDRRRCHCLVLDQQISALGTGSQISMDEEDDECVPFPALSAYVLRFGSPGSRSYLIRLLPALLHRLCQPFDMQTGIHDVNRKHGEVHVVCTLPARPSHLMHSSPPHTHPHKLWK